MHDVTGIIADNFQLLILFKFMPNYEFDSSFFIHAKIAVGKTSKRKKQEKIHQTAFMKHTNMC